MLVTTRCRHRSRHGRFWGPQQECPRHAAGGGHATSLHALLPALRSAPDARIPDRRAPPAPPATGPAIPGDAGRGRGRDRPGEYREMLSLQNPRNRIEYRTPALNDNYRPGTPAP